MLKRLPGKLRIFCGLYGCWEKDDGICLEYEKMESDCKAESGSLGRAKFMKVLAQTTPRYLTGRYVVC